MNKIIYIDGTLADDLGRLRLKEMLQGIADDLNRPVDMLTHTPSKYHQNYRFTAEPGGTDD